MGLLILPALALSSGVASADKIALTCSGTMLIMGTKEPAPNQSLVIDLERGSVTSSFGDFPIIKRTAASVDFKGNSDDGQTVWHGYVNRLLGLATMSAWRNKALVVHYLLTCKRANPPLLVE
jgi:hypothetical protein